MNKQEIMKNKLLILLDNSYSPYSKFRVASILVMKDGREFNGVNVENASYGASICSERSAIVSAISNGYKKGDFESLYVMCGDSNTISTCCFVCRQVISEFFLPDDIITCFDKNGNYKEFKVNELCPYPFTEEDLK
ncbi:MAG: cytidine deaminase [Clostridium sp.]|nr:cytidine deaminase [Clostridium sp.]MCM1444284.1 cytidine deaminase [Candidatus Amulumruptor caecigallinarius]